MDDSFQLSFTQLRAAPQGSGIKRKLKPGHNHPQTFKRLKQIVVTIKNKDNLCCARAIVMAKVKVDNHPQWESFKHGKSIQRTEALNLHWEAQVPFGACGYPELQKFTLAPSLYNYQLLVIDETRSYHVDAFGPHQDKQPHLFNRPENQNYEGSIPDQHYYMPEVMSVSGRKAFETCHAQQTGTFNFVEELVAYCESDVKLLKDCCLKFKQLF